MHFALSGQAPGKTERDKAMRILGLLGIALPLLALALELICGAMASFLFDPLPTVAHAVLVGTIPLSNLLMMQALRRGEASLGKKAALLHAFAIGIALIYVLRFLPLTPIAPFAILLFGAGLLLLAPALSLYAALRARRLIAARGAGAPPYLWRGIGLALAAILLLEAPAAAHRIGMQMANADSPDTRTAGLRWLRLVGSESQLLRYCYAHSDQSPTLLGSVLDMRDSFDTNQARSIFFKVTGTVFSSHPVPPPRKSVYRGPIFDDFTGGEQVGQRINGVQLTSSRMDGSVDANAAVGYLEWTMEFHNATWMRQEGRTEIILPPGAVVSRATLWINGEEREAAFGGRGAVRAAYQKVVRARRDPLLVTTSGADRVLVQLFPIEPGSSMKIRIGITSPMRVDTLSRASLALPTFSERNVELAPSLKHAVWIESSTPLDGSRGLNKEQLAPQQFALRGQLDDPGPREAAASISALRTRPHAQAWSKDERRADDSMIVQSITTVPAVAPHRVAIVLDGSAALRQTVTRLNSVLAQLPLAVEAALVFADDGAPRMLVHRRDNPDATRAFLRELEFEGGRDNTQALLQAFEWVGPDAPGAVIWLHGPQPELDTPIEPLVQLLQRRPSAATLYDVALVRGPNRVTGKLAGLVAIEAVPRAASALDDVAQLLTRWQPGASRVAVIRERMPLAAMPQASLTSGHLTRLWAAARVTALAADPKQRDAAVATATRYQLVTPVSGAVVLETQQQYKDAGLEPVEPGTVPTIPEPETWAMLIVALLVLSMRLRARRA